jgi:hypothetical protein
MRNIHGRTSPRQRLNLWQYVAQGITRLSESISAASLSRPVALPKMPVTIGPGEIPGEIL